MMRIYKLSATTKVEKNIILHFINLNPRYLAHNMVLRKIFGPRKEKVTGYCRRLHNDELHDLYCSPNII
jgi:hypothetical protein